eukprot:TRINITY_DN4154_c0_g1_i1.p1 TRINITY_DN4154_c0_g1~~TRINITY_DN4154_c0_g1_i1.p1  ORF type:complete len:243 (+),score=54.07 TRINITY_DN4154_c0_g1_i1:142-870(+)
MCIRDRVSTQSTGEPALAMAEQGGELNWQQQELMNKKAPKKDSWADSEDPSTTDPAPSTGYADSGSAPRRDDRGSSWGGKDEGIKLYVGNLAWQTRLEDLGEYFNQFGDCLNAIVVEDRETGNSRGFGFVYMADMAGAEAAIAETNERDFMGRCIRVNIAEEKSRGGGRGGGNRSYGFGGGGDRDSYGDRGGGRDSYSDRGDRGGDRYSDEPRERHQDEWNGEKFDRSNKYGGSRIPEGRWR